MSVSPVEAPPLRLMDYSPIMSTVSTDRHDRVLIVRIEREERRNAINRETAEGIEAALNLLDDDPDLRVGIITGTPSIFCAGTDIRERADLRMPRGGEYGVIRRRRNKPLIAAVEGYALGGGFEIALACDLIVASATAQFGLPETKRGLVATSGALFRAPRVLPINVARELLITGRTLDPERAKDLGVVNAVTAEGKALDEALVMAAEICESSPTSVSLSLKAIDALYADADAVGWEVTDDAKDAVLRSPDIAEGLDAFASRRTPRWSGLPPA